MRATLDMDIDIIESFNTEMKCGPLNPHLVARVINAFLEQELPHRNIRVHVGAGPVDGRFGIQLDGKFLHTELNATSSELNALVGDEVYNALVHINSKCSMDFSDKHL